MKHLKNIGIVVLVLFLIAGITDIIHRIHKPINYDIVSGYTVSAEDSIHSIHLNEFAHDSSTIKIDTAIMNNGDTAIGYFNIHKLVWNKKDTVKWLPIYFDDQTKKVSNKHSIPFIMNHSKLTPENIADSSKSSTFTFNADTVYKDTDATFYRDFSIDTITMSKKKHLSIRHSHN